MRAGTLLLRAYEDRLDVLPAQLSLRSEAKKSIAIREEPPNARQRAVCLSSPKGWQTVAVRHQQLLTFDRRRIFDANYLRIRSFSDLRLSGAAREPA